MIRKFLVVLFFLISFVSFAQQGSASPYSFFGIGDVRFKGTHDMNAMGGLSIVPDSIHINLKNPASYSGLKLTTFTIGGSYNATKFKSNTESENAKRITLDYLAVAFPLKKMGFAFGLIPYSSVGYKIKNQYDDGVIIDSLNRYSGTGGLNKAFLGFGYKFSKFSVGAEMAYNFGRIETESIKYIGVSQNGSQESNVSTMSGLDIKIGAMYNAKITKKLDLYSGITYSPQSDLNSSNERTVFTVRYVGDLTPIPQDYLDVINSKTVIQMPSTFSIGAGVGESKKWIIGTEVTFKASNTFSNRISDVTKVSYENGTKYTLGGYYIPNYNSFDNYFKKITYRGGFRYENTGLVVNTFSINDYALTGGLGLPVGGTFSNLNLGFELGRRGTARANLIEENYVNIILSLSLNDKWFTPRKYD